jgi:hypothetical protein
MKASVQIGYKNYVMDAEKALTLLGLLDGAEMFDTKWDSQSKTTAHYIYPQDTQDYIREMKLIPDALYKLAKLAGKPNKE